MYFIDTNKCVLMFNDCPCHAVLSSTYMLSSDNLVHSALSVKCQKKCIIFPEIIFAPPPTEKKTNAKLLPFSDAFGIYIADGTFSMKIQRSGSSLMLTRLFLL